VGYLYNGQGIGAGKNKPGRYCIFNLTHLLANANTMDIVANNQVITSTTVADGWVNIQYQ
jgi:hypothetical protein